MKKLVIIILILMALLWIFLRQNRGKSLKDIFYFEDMTDTILEKSAGS